MATFAVLGDRTEFPDPNEAEENGLVAVSHRLTTERLIAAYERGIFPWFDSDDAPVLWWSPDPRAVLELTDLKVSRSLAKRIRNGGFRVQFDTAFEEVMAECAAPRSGEAGTWITAEMRWHYGRLHELGLAHSVETWHDDALVGGLYGISLGRMFFGESMFTRQSDASKVALVHLVEALKRWGFDLIDCQLMNPHLASLGATTMPRSAFLARVRRNTQFDTKLGPWHLDESRSDEGPFDN